MSIILDPNQPVGYTPREGGPTYLLRPPTVADRNEYKHALRVKRAAFHPHLELLDITKRALDRLLPPTDDNAETRAESIAVIDEYRQLLTAAIEERKETKSEETDKAFVEALQFPELLTRLIDALCGGGGDRGDLELSTAFADNSVYWDKAGEVAAKLFLVGWEGLGRFKRGLTGPTEASLRQIDPADLVMIAIRIEQMMQLDEARTKNLNSASSGRSEGTKSSSAGKITRRNGHSQTETATV